MIALLKKYSQTLFAGVLLLISSIGMILLKARIESKEAKPIDEFYFSALQLLFFGTLFYLMVSWLFQKWREYQTLKNDKAKAELMNLRSQISPHFFFNTLNNLYGLIKKDSEKAREFVLQLSDLMRYSIYSTDNGKVGILEEVEYLKNYIDLHSMRYFKTVEVEFEKQIEAEQFEVHPLLLIILVENAFKHGVEKLTDNAFVKIKLLVDHNKLIFSIKNNFDPQKKQDNTGIGLQNLSQRLELLYPNKHQLTILEEGSTFNAYLELLV